jgi:hypothetical protein
MINPQENATSAIIPFKVPGCRLRPLEIRDHRVDRFLFRAMFRARRSPLTRRGPMKALVKGTLPMYGVIFFTLLNAMPTEDKR